MFLFIVSCVAFGVFSFLLFCILIVYWPTKARERERVLKEYITGRRERLDWNKLAIIFFLWILSGWFIFDKF